MKVLELQRERNPVGWRTLLLVAVLAVATVVLVFVGNGNLAIALAPCLALVLVCGIWFLPLRIPMLMLFVMAWAVEAPGDAFASGIIETPWRMVGQLLWGKLNLVFPVGALVITGFDLVALLLFATIIHRHSRHATIDQDGWVESPIPIAIFACLSLVAVGWMSFYGLARGGSFRFILWQSIRWLYLPIVYLLMNQALRGPRDAALVGKLLLGVGVFRAGEAISFRLAFPVEVLPHCTTHADSVLFATCVSVLAAMVLEMPGKRTYLLCAGLLPLYLWAMKANNRRLVWAELGLVALIFWMMSPWRPWKKKLARAAVSLSLPLLLYGVVGWNSQSAIFSPVRKVRSMTDSKSNTSTLWRELEDYNLVYTFQQSPVVGSGFGHPFIMAIKLPDVENVYELERYIPHNSVLGLWAFGGLLGFALIWAVFPVGIFFTVRAYHWSRTPMERVTALGAAAVQVCYVAQGYGDLGFGSWGSIFTVATSYVLIGKICVANKAWGSRRALREAAEEDSRNFPVRSPVEVLTGLPPGS